MQLLCISKNQERPTTTTTTTTTKRNEIRKQQPIKTSFQPKSALDSSKQKLSKKAFPEKQQTSK